MGTLIMESDSRKIGTGQSEETVQWYQRINFRSLSSVLILAVLVILLAFLTDGTFLTPRNLTNLARQVAINGILAVGMTYVILIGGIDLSVGSVVALSGVVAGVLQVNMGLGNWEGSQAVSGALLSVGAATLVGLVCGVFNGFLITRYRIAPFVITLGMMVIARGLALIFSNGAAISPLSDAFNFLGQEYLSRTAFIAVSVFLCGAILISKYRSSKSLFSFFAEGAAIAGLLGVSFYAFLGYSGLPVPVFIFALLGLAGSFILARTRLGRFVYAVGGNADAAWLAGVPIRKITFGIYAAMGTLAGLSGAVLAARLNGALPTAGELFELDAIAAVVIGGTSLLGGVGTVTGSILGAFFIGALNNGMSLLNVSEFYQKVIKGVIIIAAVWFDTRKNRG